MSHFIKGVTDKEEGIILKVGAKGEILTAIKGFRKL